MSSAGQTKNENMASLDKLKEVKVNFNELNDLKDEKKSRYLTAKYQTHQMSLIRKRLQVESWVYDYLTEKVCNGSEAEFDEIDIDLDEILDIEGDSKRKDFLMKKIDKPDKREEVSNFIKCLLEKVRTL